LPNTAGFVSLAPDSIGRLAQQVSLLPGNWIRYTAFTKTWAIFIDTDPSRTTARAVLGERAGTRIDRQFVIPVNISKVNGRIVLSIPRDSFAANRGLSSLLCDAFALFNPVATAVLCDDPITVAACAASPFDPSFWAQAAFCPSQEIVPACSFSLGNVENSCVPVGSSVTLVPSAQGSFCDFGGPNNRRCFAAWEVEVFNRGNPYPPAKLLWPGSSDFGYHNAFSYEAIGHVESTSLSNQSVDDGAYQGYQSFRIDNSPPTSTDYVAYDNGFCLSWYDGGGVQFETCQVSPVYPID